MFQDWDQCHQWNLWERHETLWDAVAFSATFLGSHQLWFNKVFPAIGKGFHSFTASLSYTCRNKSSSFFIPSVVPWQRALRWLPRPTCLGSGKSLRFLSWGLFAQVTLKGLILAPEISLKKKQNKQENFSIKHFTFPACLKPIKWIYLTEDYGSKTCLWKQSRVLWERSKLWFAGYGFAL